MGRAPVSGREAKRYARIAQVAGLALAASAAVLLAVEVPMLGVRETPVEEVLPPTTGPAAAAPAAQPTREFSADDMTGIDTRLATARVAPPKKADTEVAANPDGTAPPATSGAPTGWRYLGSVIEPNRRVALVSIDGRQRMLAEGRDVDGIKLVAVKSDQIVVEENGGRRAIERESRTGSPVAWVQMAAPPAGNGSGPGMDPAMAEDMASRQAEVMDRSGMSRDERMKRAEEFRARAREARRARDQRGAPDDVVRQRMMEAEEMEGE